jgi:hypothetical protein
MNHAELLAAVKEALVAFNEDTSVPKQQTKDELEEISDDLDSYIEEITNEIEAEGEGEEDEEETAAEPKDDANKEI